MPSPTMASTASRIMSASISPDSFSNSSLIASLALDPTMFIIASDAAALAASEPPAVATAKATRIKFSGVIVFLTKPLI